jgi:hypothetical protein
MTLLQTDNLHSAERDSVNDEFKEMWKEIVVADFKAQYQHFP